MELGRILRIEKLSCYDGDGLRTVVFLKGCPLRCSWCSTPESHNLHTDFGNYKDKCIHCFTCIEVCPENAISYEGETDVFTTDMNKCSDCRLCIEKCTPGSRIAYGFDGSINGLMKEIEKDSLFYFHSGGGVTVSGGEPTMQPDFLRELLESCCMLGVNTALETCGYTKWENLEQSLPFLDTVFFDLKHMDTTAHAAITGVQNRRILENLRKLNDSPHRFTLIVRMPVIPSVNDSVDNFRVLGDFCRSLEKVKKVQLLPYHRLGLETYQRLSLPYSLQQQGSLSPDELQENAEILKKSGLKVTIGS